MQEDNEVALGVFPRCSSQVGGAAWEKAQRGWFDNVTMEPSSTSGGSDHPFEV